MRIILAISILALMSCTDAARDSLNAFGNEADIFCYSGGKKIFEDKSTGKVTILQGGGWHYRSVNGQYIRTFADCFVSVKSLTNSSE